MNTHLNTHLKHTCHLQAHRQRSSLNDGAALDLNVLGRSYGAESFNERAQLERAYGMAFPQNAASHRKGMEHEWACDASRMALVPASTSSAPRRRRATGRLPRRHRAVPAAASDTSQSSGVSGESLRGREALHNIEAGVHGPCLGRYVRPCQSYTVCRCHWGTGVPAAAWGAKHRRGLRPTLVVTWLRQSLPGGSCSMML